MCILIAGFFVLICSFVNNFLLFLIANVSSSPCLNITRFHVAAIFLLQAGLARFGLADFHAVASAKSVTEIILFFVYRCLVMKDQSLCIVVEK